MHDYSSSDPTAASARGEATLQLGRKLTQELALDKSGDTLGLWMAHYTAELIHDAENASAEERPAKMQVCSEAILNLWRRLHELPDGKRPFEEHEPILRALESLDPDADTPRYYRSAKTASEGEEEDTAAKSWLQRIDSLDYSARLLIRYCFTRAAQTTLDKAAEWVALAEATGADDQIEVHIIRAVADENDLLTKLNLDEIEKEQLQDRINRLEEFIVMANALTSELRQRISYRLP